MTQFQQKGYCLVKNAISKELADFAADEIRMLRDVLTKQHPNENFGDGQSLNSFSWYSAFVTETLLKILQSKIEHETNLKLYPSYSYCRIYYNGGTLERHKDRPSCQISATLTLSQKQIWDIWIESLEGEDYSPNSLNVGDMLVYRGDLLDHGRETYNGDEHIQAFLHYVIADGEYSYLKFDGREGLGFPIA